MDNDKEFVHFIQTLYGYYVFDVNTNNIIEVSKNVYEELKTKNNNTEAIDEEARKKINDMKKEGLFSSKRAKSIVHPQSKYIEYHLKHKVRKVTLQVTQKCNFRCSYCVYSASANDRQRAHSLKSMSFETAKKSIDFLVNHSRDLDFTNIGFYGGEPLLEFELIKKCIEYSEYELEGKKVTYSITTNGSLLTDEIVEYFIKHDVSTMISLDGPKEIHDRQRRFAANGCGTFDVIERNLLRIRDKYPEYFKKLHFSVVIDPRNDFECVNRLYTDYDIFKEVTVRSSTIDDVYSNEKTFFTEEYIMKRDYEIFKAYLYYFNRLHRNDVSPIAVQEISQIENISRKFGHIKEMPDNTSHAGPCIPGALRLFINSDGYLYPCERVSEMSDAMTLGHVDTGFNIEKARNILNVGSLTEKTCINCWAIGHCTLCAKHADNLRELSGNMKMSFCREVRNHTDHSFRNYIAFKEVKTHFSNLIK